MEKNQYKIINIPGYIREDSLWSYKFSFSITDGKKEMRIDVTTSGESMLNLGLPADLKSEENSKKEVEVVEKWKRIIQEKYIKLIAANPDDYFSEKVLVSNEEYDNFRDEEQF